MGVCCFFFSSRRRHTRSLCDWSSDVCSSDLFSYVYRIYFRPNTGVNVQEIDREDLKYKYEKISIEKAGKFHLHT